MVYGKPATNFTIYYMLKVFECDLRVTGWPKELSFQTSKQWCLYYCSVHIHNIFFFFSFFGKDVYFGWGLEMLESLQRIKWPPSQKYRLPWKHLQLSACLMLLEDFKEPVLGCFNPYRAAWSNLTCNASKGDISLFFLGFFDFSPLFCEETLLRHNELCCKKIVKLKQK